MPGNRTQVISYRQRPRNQLIQSPLCYFSANFDIFVVLPESDMTLGFVTFRILTLPSCPESGILDLDTYPRKSDDSTATRPSALPSGGLRTCVNLPRRQQVLHPPSPLLPMHSRGTFSPGEEHVSFTVSEVPSPPAGARAC